MTKNEIRFWKHFDDKRLATKHLQLTRNFMTRAQRTSLELNKT